MSFVGFFFCQLKSVICKSASDVKACVASPSGTFLLVFYLILCANAMEDVLFFFLFNCNEMVLFLIWFLLYISHHLWDVLVFFNASNPVLHDLSFGFYFTFPVMSKLFSLVIFPFVKSALCFSFSCHSPFLNNLFWSEVFKIMEWSPFESILIVVSHMSLSLVAKQHQTRGWTVCKKLDE